MAKRREPDTFKGLINARDAVMPVLVTPEIFRVVRKKGRDCWLLHCRTLVASHGVPKGTVIWCDRTMIVRPDPVVRNTVTKRRRESRLKAQLLKSHQPGGRNTQGSDRTERATVIADTQVSSVVKCSQCGKDVKVFGGQDTAHCPECKSE